MDQVVKRPEIVFENIWGKQAPEIRKQAIAIWSQSPVFDQAELVRRAKQIVFVAKNEQAQVVAISTAYKAFVKQLKNYFYVYRCLVTHEYSIPGIDAKITVLTRDFLESIRQNDESDKAIGVLTLVQHPKLKERNQAVWPATGLTYIGNTGNGDHIRVYYFDKAEIIQR